MSSSIALRRSPKPGAFTDQGVPGSSPGGGTIISAKSSGNRAFFDFEAPCQYASGSAGYGIVTKKRRKNARQLCASTRHVGLSDDRLSECWVRRRTACTMSLNAQGRPVQVCVSDRRSIFICRNMFRPAISTSTRNATSDPTSARRAPPKNQNRFSWRRDMPSAPASRFRMAALVQMPATTPRATASSSARILR